MKHFSLKSLLAACLLPALLSCASPKQEAEAPKLPALKVVGTQLMNERGDTVALHGVSYGWHQFWPRFYNDSTVAYFAREWKADVVRASMGTDLDEDCYIHKPQEGIDCVTRVVDAAIAHGVYAIIDWHSHHLLLDGAKQFFARMATRYKGVTNVIYEIYNEPVDDTWPEVKAYAEEVIATIRAIDPEALILVGCPHWDEDIRLVADDPIRDGHNIMYTVHFYANTHGKWLRDASDYALAKGIPVFVSECAGMEASGDGPLSPESWREWVSWMDAHHISWVAWSVSDKDETCSMLLPSASSTGYWPDAHIKEWGRMVRAELARYGR